MSTSKLLTVGLGIAVLFMFACQSAEGKQEAELRHFLRDQVKKLGTLNAQLLEDYQVYLQERIETGEEREVARVRRTLEDAQQTLPAELDTLRQNIEEYPALELSGLSEEIKIALDRGRLRVEDLARERHEARRADELSQHWGRVGKSMRESIRRQAQDGPAWLRTKPKQAKEE